MTAALTEIHKSPIRGHSVYRPISAKAASRSTGLLLGTAASVVGVAAVLPGGLRLWHVLVIVALINSTAYAYASGSLRRIRVTPLAIIVALFVTACILSEVQNANDLGVEFGFSSVTAPLVSFLGYFAARFVVRDAQDLRHFLRSFMAPVIPVVLIGLAQVTGFAAIDRLILLIAPAEGAERRLDVGGLTRATSLVGHWTGFGTYLTVIVAAVCVLAIVERSLGHPRPSNLAYVTLAFSSVGLLTTFTFSTVITGAVILATSWRAARFGNRLLILAAAVGVAATALLGSSIAFRFNQQVPSNAELAADWIPTWLPDTLQYRLRVWIEQTIPMIEMRPYQGWGSDLYGATQPGRMYPSLLNWGSSESQWFGVAIAYGVFAAIALIGIIAATFYAISIIRRNLSSPANLISRPLSTLLVMMVLTSFTVSAFTNRGFPAAFWPILGACLAFALAPSPIKTPQSIAKFQSP